VAQRYEGKAKVVEETAEGLVRITFKDDATAGDGAMHDVFSGKGELCSEISCLLFEYLEGGGVESHDVVRSAKGFLAKHVEIVPIEVVVRNLAAGSICRRLGLEQGMELDPPLVEFFYKDDALHDPLITRAHVRVLDLATPAELDQLEAMALKVNQELGALFGRAGLQLVDYKLEYGRCDGKLLLADEISPDTCRFWRDGQSLDKDVFRRGDGSPLAGYREVLRLIKPLLATEAVG
jgi:phosphoribosylaminoimidazole-succinocarboxamide synthase